MLELYLFHNMINNVVRYNKAKTQEEACKTDFISEEFKDTLPDYVKAFDNNHKS